MTEKGLALFPLLVALRQWGEAFFFDAREPHVALVDAKSGRPVRKLELRSHDGRLLGPKDTLVEAPRPPNARARSPAITKTASARRKRS